MNVTTFRFFMSGVLTGLCLYIPNSRSGYLTSTHITENRLKHASGPDQFEPVTCMKRATGHYSVLGHFFWPSDFLVIQSSGHGLLDPLGKNQLKSGKKRWDFDY